MLTLALNFIDRLIALAKRHEEVSRNLFSDFVKPAMEDFEKLHGDYIESFRKYSAMLQDEKTPLDFAHPVFQALEIDSVASEHLRTKLLELDRLSENPRLQPFIKSLVSYLGAVPKTLEEYSVNHYTQEDPAGLQSSDQVNLEASATDVGPGSIRKMSAAANKKGQLIESLNRVIGTANLIRVAYAMAIVNVEVGSLKNVPKGTLKELEKIEDETRKRLLHLTLDVIGALQDRHKAAVREFNDLKVILLKPI